MVLKERVRTMSQRRPGKNFHIRLDEPLRQQLAASAEQELRSIHKEIIKRLRASFGTGQDRATAAHAEVTAA
jgi:hypothetical protein